MNQSSVPRRVNPWHHVDQATDDPQVRAPHITRLLSQAFAVDEPTRLGWELRRRVLLHQERLLPVIDEAPIWGQIRTKIYLLAIKGV